MTGQRVLVTGGAGFIGSHLVRRLLDETGGVVVVIDNFSSGAEWRLGDALGSSRLEVVRADLKDPGPLIEAAEGADHVFHLAANPDIARAIDDPTVDFWEGTFLAQNVAEAARLAGVARITFTSGSGVYGDLGESPVIEDETPLRPISPYGASKLACEAILSAYAHMFGIHATALRFANVVGPRQTHGVAYDFIRRLRQDQTTLTIQGDGTQSKSYVHVDDVVNALLLPGVQEWSGFEAVNVATDDYVTVVEIADLVCEHLGLSDVEYRFTGGRRGWTGDVPIVRFDSSKIRMRGWRSERTSYEALRDSVGAMTEELAR